MFFYCVELERSKPKRVFPAYHPIHGVDRLPVETRHLYGRISLSHPLTDSPTSRLSRRPTAYPRQGAPEQVLCLRVSLLALWALGNQILSPLSPHSLPARLLLRALSNHRLPTLARISMARDRPPFYRDSEQVQCLSEAHSRKFLALVRRLALRYSAHGTPRGANEVTLLLASRVWDQTDLALLPSRHFRRKELETMMFI